MQKRNAWICFGIAVMLEIIFLICNFIDNIRDVSCEIMYSDSFYALQDEGIIIENDVVEVSSGLSGDVLESKGINISRGIYDIFISYEGGGDDVSIWFFDSTIRSGSVVLKDGKQEISFRAWASTTEENEVFHLNTGGSSFKLKSITIMRNGRIYAVYSTIILTFLITIFNVFWLVWKKILMPPGGNRAFINAFIIAGIACMASMPLFVRNMVPGIDIVFHMYRIEGIAQGLRMGQFPIRMQPLWFDGQGYPVSVFYGDIFLYFPALLRLFGFTIQDAYKCYIFVINLATAYISWQCIRKMFHNNAVALAGSAFYTISVYRLINIYVRAAVGEATAMTFFPLVVYGFWKIISRPNGEKQPPFNWLPLAAGYTGIICSHMLSCEMVFAVTVLACVVFIRKVLQRDVFIALLKAVVSTAALTAWMLVPFLDYMQDSYNITAAPGYGLEENAAFLGQIFGLYYSGVTNRYSLDLNSGTHNEMSMGVGFVLPLGAAIFIMLTIMYDNIKNDDLWRLGNVCLWMSVLCIWLSSDLFPWGSVVRLSEIINVLAGMLQFSWRFLGIATVFLVVTVSSGIALIARRGQKVACFVIIVLLLLNTVMWGNFVETALVDNENAEYYSAANLLSLQWGNGDYLPYGSDYWSYTTDRSVKGENVEVIDAQIEPLQVTVKCVSDKDGSLSVPLIYYRHYYAEDIVSGNVLPVSCDTERYTVKVSLPPEFEGTVLVKFREPWFWRLSEAVSLGTLIGILLFRYINLHNKRASI